MQQMEWCHFLICNSPITNAVEYPIICLLVVWVSLFVNWHICSLPFVLLDYFLSPSLLFCPNLQEGFFFFWYILDVNLVGFEMVQVPSISFFYLFVKFFLWIPWWNTIFNFVIVKSIHIFFTFQVLFRKYFSILGQGRCVSTICLFLFEFHSGFWFHFHFHFYLFVDLGMWKCEYNLCFFSHV